MNAEAVEGLMDRWMNDPTFRADLRANPEQAVKNVGITLNQDEMAALNSVDWSLSDDELTQRVTKSSIGDYLHRTLNLGSLGNPITGG